MRLLDPSKLMFVDAAKLAPTSGSPRCAPGRRRASGHSGRRRQLRCCGKNTTLLAGMGPCGMGPCLAVEGGTTKAVFEAYVERALAPSLSPGQVVAMDDLSAHKGERVRELVEEGGAEVPFLPSYSPDFSPMEEAFGKVKSLLRRAGARAKEALVEAIGWALGAVTPEDARGWFAHCGYALRGQLP